MTTPRHALFKKQNPPEKAGAGPSRELIAAPLHGAGSGVNIG